MLIGLMGAENVADSLRQMIDRQASVRTVSINESPEKCDAVVVAAAYSSLTADEAGRLADLLRNARQPVLGVGGGFQVVCGLLGVAGPAQDDIAVAAERCVPTDKGAKLFQGTDPIRVAPTERWLVDDLPKSLQVLARSDSGIEAFRHKTLPYFGLQLLPDDFIYPSDAGLVYGNFLEVLAGHLVA